MNAETSSEIGSAPYAGVVSFARQPLARDAAGADIAVIGVPFDLGTSYRPGARLGPRALREQSLFVGQYPWGHWPWDFNIYERARIVDLGDVPMTVFWQSHPERMVADVKRAAAAAIGQGASLLALGGDHMVTGPLLAATAAAHGPLALVHLDAHSDSWDMGGDLNHGTVFRLAATEGWVVPERSVQIGIRTPNPDTMGFHTIDAIALLERPLATTVAEVREIVGDAPAYVSFDIDFLDPAFAPGTGTPTPGGPSTHQARRLLHALAGLRVVGADVVEVAPNLEGGVATAIAGATIALDLLHLLALGRARPA